ncbi:MAG: sulfotransferase domain-containing protein, partial [Verrucomicrobiota bacterium]
RFQHSTLEDYLGLYETTWTDRLNRHYDAFRRCFSKHDIRVRGEGTATYATLPEAVMAEIALLNPDMKVIVMARHPVQRAISHARKDLNRQFNGDEVPEEAILDFVSTGSQLRLGDYPGIVATWRKYLKHDHVMFGDYRLIQGDPVKLLSEVQRFLEIRVGKRYTKTRLLRERINPTEKAPLSEAVQQQIEQLYAPHVASYEGLWPA